MKKQFAYWAIIPLSLACVASWSGSKATATPEGETVFKNNCVACHAAGKNSLDPRKPIIGSRKLASKEDFKEYLGKGSGAMPPFPAVCKDDGSLTALYTYCKSLK